MRAGGWFSLVALLVLVGCTAQGTASDPPAAFTIDLLPAEEPTANRMAIPGSRYCFLVLIQDPSGSSTPATIEASATKATVAAIEPEKLSPGVVGEIWVIADATDVETAGTLSVTASRNGVSRTATRTIAVFPMADDRAADAQPYFERWVAWLATAHPELGIDAEEEWEPVFVSTLLVVSHYSYWSEEWELTVAWHNMIAPHDWTDVFLRRRGTETAPQLAFRIDSVSGETAPHAIEPPAELVR